MTRIKCFTVSLLGVLCRPENLEITQRIQALVKAERNETFQIGVIPVKLLMADGWYACVYVAYVVDG